jgi:hypothetical protein
VEGVFDHIVVPNSIPLLGKVVSDYLNEQLQLKACGNVVICLDDDAWEDSIKVYKKLNSGRLYGKIRVIKMPKGYDLSELHQNFGKPAIIKLLKKSFKLKESLL